MPGWRKSSTGMRRLSKIGGRPGGVNGSGTMPKLQMAVDGVAPSMWLRGSLIDLLLAHVDPHRVRRAARVEERQRSLDRHAGLHPRAELIGLLGEQLEVGHAGFLSSP